MSSSSSRKNQILSANNRERLGEVINDWASAMNQEHSKYNRRVYSASNSAVPIPDQLQANNSYDSIYSTPFVSDPVSTAQVYGQGFEYDYLEDSDHSDYENAWLQSVNYFTLPSSQQQHLDDTYTDAWLKNLDYHLNGGVPSSADHGSILPQNSTGDSFLLDDVVRDTTSTQGSHANGSHYTAQNLIDVSDTSGIDSSAGAPRVPVESIKFEPLVGADIQDTNNSSADEFFREYFGQSAIHSPAPENNMINLIDDKLSKVSQIADTTTTRRTEVERKTTDTTAIQQADLLNNDWQHQSSAVDNNSWETINTPSTPTSSWETAQTSMYQSVTWDDTNAQASNETPMHHGTSWNSYSTSDINQACGLFEAATTSAINHDVSMAATVTTTVQETITTTTTEASTAIHHSASLWESSSTNTVLLAPEENEAAKKWKLFAEQNDAGSTSPSWQAPLAPPATDGKTDDGASKASADIIHDDKHTGDTTAEIINSKYRVTNSVVDKDEDNSRIKYKRSDLFNISNEMKDTDTNVGKLAGRLLNIYLVVRTTLRESSNAERVTEQGGDPEKDAKKEEGAIDLPSAYARLIRQPKNCPDSIARGFDPGVPYFKTDAISAKFLCLKCRGRI